MFKSTVIARHSGACFRRTVPLFNAKVVPASQIPSNDAWFAHGTHFGGCATSAGQAVSAQQCDILAKDLERQQLKAAVQASLQRNNNKGVDASSSSSSSSSSSGSAPTSSSALNNKDNTFSRINLAEDYLNASKAEHEDILASATMFGSQGERLSAAPATDEAAAAEEAKKYISQLDLSHMPDIPGMKKEELALKLLEFEKKKAQQQAEIFSGEAEKNKRLNQIEAMRMSLSPRDFKEFVTAMEKAAESSEAELEKMRAMTPQQLYLYHKQMERKTAFKQWINFIIYCSMSVSGFLSIYYIMYVHFAM